MPEFRWISEVLPRIDRIGRYPIRPQQGELDYMDPTHAVHLFEYRGEIHFPTRKIIIEPGDLLITPAQTKTNTFIKTSSHHRCVHFWPQPRSKRPFVHLPLHMKLGATASLAGQKLAWIEHLWRLSWGKLKTNQAAQFAASAALQELLLWLATIRHTDSGPAKPTRITQALLHCHRALEERLTEPLTVELLAHETGLNPDYLSRGFQKHYGIPILRALLLRRIDLARHYLIVSQMRIKEIAGLVGMPDAHYFNKRFRELMGQSPTHYRLTMRP